MFRYNIEVNDYDDDYRNIDNPFTKTKQNCLVWYFSVNSITWNRSIQITLIDFLWFVTDLLTEENFWIKYPVLILFLTDHSNKQFSKY